MFITVRHDDAVRRHYMFGTAGPLFCATRASGHTAEQYRLGFETSNDLTGRRKWQVRPTRGHGHHGQMCRYDRASTNQPAAVCRILGAHDRCAVRTLHAHYTSRDFVYGSNRCHLHQGRALRTGYSDTYCHWNCAGVLCTCTSGILWQSTLYPVLSEL